MSDWIIKEIETLLKEDERALTAAKKRLERSAEGTIHLRRRGETVSYYHEIPGGENEPRREAYIPRSNRRLLNSLCTKKYCKMLIPALEKEIRQLRSFLAVFDPQSKYHVLDEMSPDLAAYITPVLITNEQFVREWTSAAFDRNPYPLGHDSYLTKNGEYVRSRLELIVANMLYDLGIPYRYECALYLEDGTVVYPDFTILHPRTLEVYWLELLGMMDDPDYTAANLQKITRYAQSEMFPRLIMVFDHKEAPFRTEAMEEILRNCFLK